MASFLYAYACTGIFVAAGLGIISNLWSEVEPLKLSSAIVFAALWPFIFLHCFVRRIRAHR